MRPKTNVLLSSYNQNGNLTNGVTSTASPSPPAVYSNIAENNNIVDVTKEIREHCQVWIMSDEQNKKQGELFLDNIKRGLGKDTHAKAITKCFVTYVTDLPDGTEQGKILALDLGGTNFRVLMIELKGKGQPDMTSEIYAIPQEIMTGPGVNLFDHIATCLGDFIKNHKLEDQVLPLGFTFSFPLKQQGLKKGVLERWTKGFSCDGVVGQEVVGMLETAINKAGLKIDCCAILNDTTGTLMSCAFKNPDCKVGLIVGTGTNACYVERIENAECYEGDKTGVTHVIINCESGAFGDDGCLEFMRNEYDETVDANSINPKLQLFEKMISGMYLGELVRLTAKKAIEKGILFDGKSSDKFDERNSFETKFVSDIESETRGTFTECHAILASLGLGNATDQDCANLRYICEVVTARAAHIVSVNLATLINKIVRESDKGLSETVTVGIDGSVYRFHPKFHDLMMKKMSQLVTPGVKFDIMLSHDGSGRGAALIAAVASKLKQNVSN
ncbi:hexokinase type 2-like isoform X2 [Chrysoperla carnea]|uniref:hexokinase type 2-like isoform X2 n=1 Tax=Chrysoperla carnea TaxID=189513 RepID=UPI001D05FD8D|nr:hexokinase type 2-like isoform X2 [Chrysoperla carnea]